MSNTKENMPEFRVTERHENDTSGLVYYHVDYKNRIGNRKTRVISAGMLGQTDGYNELAKYDASGTIEDFKEACISKLNVTALRKITEVDQTGWHGNYLVTRHGTIGEEVPGQIVLSARASDQVDEFEKQSVKGSVESFVQGLSKFAEKSDIIILMYLAGLWASLGSRIGYSVGHIICITGQGSTGKTSALCMSTALTQYAHDDQQLLNFGDTEGVLLDKIPLMSGTINAFSDFKNDPQKNAAAFKKIHSMMFAGTSGKTRRRKGEEKLNLKHPIYCAQLAFAMEMSLERAFLKAGIPLEDGERVRVIELEVPKRRNGGIFEGLSRKKSKAMIAQFREFLNLNYGTVTPAWVEFIQDTSKDEIADMVKHFGDKPFHKIVSDDGLVERIEQYLKCLWATAQIAQQADLLPVSLGRVEKALSSIFERYTEKLQSDEDRRNIIKRDVRSKLRSKEIFPLLKTGKPPKSKQDVSCGFRRRDSDNVWLHVRKNKFVKLFPKENQPFVLEYLQVLAQKGWAKKAKGGGYSHIVKQNGIDKKLRYMKFDTSKLMTKPKKPK